MNIMIDIDCCTIEELIAHLTCLKIQIKKQVKVNKQDPSKEDFAVGTRLEDNNCYGTHELNVIHYIK